MHAAVTVRELLSGGKVTAALQPFGRSGRGDLGGEQTGRPERKE